ncbi:GGDEF domain-containing protein [Shewanella submarina]|nr:GGDEF domain-containing protein [Shewanella submarina]
MAAVVECELETLQTAHHDELSGLVNGRGLILLGDHSTKLCHRSGINLTMLLFDIDNFDAFNEGYGEDLGDLVLMDFAMLLRKVFRESDLLARTGGDEFVVLLANADKSKAALALERFRLAVHDYNRRQSRTTHLKFTSVAVELDHGHHGDIEALLADAWSRMAKLN